MFVQTICNTILISLLLAAHCSLATEDHFAFESLQWQATTPSYKQAAVRVLTEEANRIALELGLAERLPIQESDLVEAFIQTPFMAENAGLLGSISTSNFHYYASVDNKLSYVVRNFGRNDVRERAYMDSLRRLYALPKSQMNTNAAYQQAAQWLEASGMDVKALDKDSRIEINVWDLGDKFVPIYYISWLQPKAVPPQANNADGDSSETVANVQLLEPEHRLLQMHVEKTQYIKRKPVIVPNRDQLLQQSDDPRIKQIWFTTEAYKRAALEVMIKEVNQLCRQLNLPELIQSSNLVRTKIETPSVADHLGRFAIISTKNYTYGALCGNKLSFFTKNMGDESQYLASITPRYEIFKSKIYTNSTYLLASKWLEAASVDIKALERDCLLDISTLNLRNMTVRAYKLEWVIGDGIKQEREVVATVELLEPEHSLLEFSIEKPEYLKREPLIVPNREELLAQTNTPPQVNAPAKQ